MSRVPPESERLRFAQNVKTGCVHIMAGPGHSGGEAVVEAFNGTTGPDLLNVLLAKTPMLCGTRLWTGPADHYHAVYISGDVFPDDVLCAACLRALGDQSWRAFHIDNRGSDETE